MPRFSLRNTLTGTRTEIEGPTPLQLREWLSSGAYTVQRLSAEAPAPLFIPPGYHPERTLAQPMQHNLPKGTQNIATNSLDGQGSLVVAFDFSDLDGSGGGLILEQGGVTLGLYIGFRANGDLVSRCGSGMSELDDDCAIAVVKAEDVPAAGQYIGEFTQLGDGRVRVRVWINRIWLASVTSLAAASGLFGSDSGRYLSTGGTGAVVQEISPGVPEATHLPGGAFGNARIYVNQPVTEDAGTLPLYDVPRQVQNVTLIPAAGVLGIYWRSAISEQEPPLQGYQVEINGTVLPEFFDHTSAYLQDLANLTYDVRVRAVNARGRPGAWSELHRATVTQDLPPPMATTLSDTVSFNGVTLTLDRPMPVGQTVDGRPVIISASDFAITSVTPASGVQPGGNTIGNGMMRDPSWFRQGRTQGFDELIANGNDATTRVPYVPELNIDPAVSGPLQITQGAATSLVKSIRLDQAQRPWADAPSQQWAIGDYAVFSVMPRPLPADAFRPAITALDKTRHLKFARTLHMDVLRDLTPPQSYLFDYDTVLANTALDHAFYGTDNGELQNVFGPDDNYSTQWQDRRKLAWAALHSNVLTLEQKRELAYIMITHALDLEAIVDAGWIGRQGAGQALGFIPYMYFGGFLLQDPGLLEKARNTLSSELGPGRHAYVPQSRIGKSGAYPDSNDQYNAPFLPEHVGTAHIYGDAKGAAINARYSSLIQDGAALATLAMILLQNGPDGENGIEAITGNAEPIGPDNPTSAPIATLDAYREVHTRGDARRYYNAWRDFAGPRYTEAPKQLPKLGSDAEFLAIRNGVSWDWSDQRDGVSGTYAHADIRYSLDQRSWTEMTGLDKTGWWTGLMAGAKYYMGIRYVDTQGRKGIWTENRGGVGPEVYVVTPTGGSPAAAPVSTRAPAVTYRPFLDAGMPFFNVIPDGGTIPREAVDIYPSIGDWTGSPVPTYRWKLRRNGMDITEYAPFALDQGGDWAEVNKYTRTQEDYSTLPNDTWLEVVIEASNANGITEAVSPRIFMPQRVTLSANVLMDTEFTDAFRLDHRDLWDDIAIANGTKSLSNDFYSSGASTPGYVFNSKDGSNATLRIQTQEFGRAGDRYRVNAEIITGSKGKTRASIRAGSTISEIGTYTAGVDPRVVRIKDAIHTVPASAEGKRITFDLFLSSVGGGTAGAGLGIISLKIERI
ncbi:hypothetical protein [Roseobacter sp. MH60115]|uniref:hypothetical protein n=1 Tax=Roseobacter sp. MH60115 TaxID=2785324 RepID=UPI0018A2D381|nr:hypothetical protein [Roseobacter sp. MH60115]